MSTETVPEHVIDGLSELRDRAERENPPLLKTGDDPVYVLDKAIEKLSDGD